MPTLAAPDLVIDKAQVAPRVDAYILAADAFVTVRNAGTADAVFHKGAIVLSGASSDPRGLRFADAAAAEDFTLTPGQTLTAVLRSVDACTAGYGTPSVTFRADPQGTVPERAQGNNSSTIAPPVGNPAAADLVVTNLSFKWGIDPRDHRSQALLLVVAVKNNGSGPALLCPGNTIVRQTASPVAGRYGLQSAVFEKPASTPPPPPPPSPPPADSRRILDAMSPPQNIVIPAGGTRDFTMLGCKSGDLQAGVYEWKVKVNPDGVIRESNAGNNETSAQLQCG